MKQHISSLIVATLLITSVTNYAAPEAAADVKARMDVRQAAASSVGEPILTLSDVQSALRQGTPAGLDTALLLLQLFSEKLPHHPQIHTAIQQLAPHVPRMSAEQETIAAQLNSSLPPAPPLSMPAISPVEREHKCAAAAGAGNFERISQLIRATVQTIRALHTSIDEQTRYPASGEEGKKISAKMHETVDGVEASLFPRELTGLIGQYAAALTSINIDAILIKAVKDLQPRIAELIRAAEHDVVNPILKNNSAAFGAYRNLARRGVPWPLSIPERRRWEAAGFTFRPMMIKRDRMVCDTCRVEVPYRLYTNGDYSAPLSYTQPADHHDYSMHAPDSLTTWKSQAIQNPAICVFTPELQQDQEGPNFIGYVLRHVNLRASQIAQLPADRVNADIAAGLLSQDLFDAAKLWANFSSTHAQLMAWSIVAKYCDKLFGDTRSDHSENYKYDKLQQQMLNPK